MTCTVVLITVEGFQYRTSTFATTADDTAYDTNQLMRRRMISLSAGGDGAQVFLNRIYGVLVCGLRITESPAGTEAKNVTWGPLSVVQGPTEPKSMHGVMAEVLAFFKKHDPGMTALNTRWV